MDLILSGIVSGTKAAGNLQTQAIKPAPRAALIYSIAAGLRWIGAERPKGRGTG